MRRGWAVGLLLIGAMPAFAAPRVAVHPLRAVGADASILEQARAAFFGEAAGQPIQMVSRTQVEGVLAKLPSKTCHLDTQACVQSLSRETGAAYVLLVELTLDGPEFVLDARVIAANGSMVTKIETLAIPKDLFTPRGPQLQAAFKAMFAKLDLQSLPPEIVDDDLAVLTAKVVPKVEPDPMTPEVPPAEHKGGSTGLRVAGLLAGGVAVGGTLAAVLLARQVSSDALEISAILKTNGGQLPQGKVGLAVAVEKNTTLATACSVGAGVAAAASLAMIVASLDWSSPVAITPIEGGAMVGLAGSF